MTAKQQLVKDIADKFPTLSTRALGRMLWKEGSQFFTSEKMAYNHAQAARGTLCPDRKAYIAAKVEFPVGKTTLKDWKPYIIDGPARALILSDLHVPYHDKSAIMQALTFGGANEIDTIILNGDTCDFFSISKWETDPRQRNFKEELKTVHSFMDFLCATFPKARKVFKLGNHEERLQSYMRHKAPELLGLECLDYDALLGLSNRGIALVGDKRPIQLGDLTVIHGHEYRFAISNPVNPARGLFLRCKDYAICGHFHQPSQHSERTVKSRSIATWSTGCLCDLHPEYLPLNNWSLGFAFVEVDNKGKFHVQNKTIKGNVIY